MLGTGHVGYRGEYTSVIVREVEQARTLGRHHFVAEYAHIVSCRTYVVREDGVRRSAYEVHTRPFADRTIDVIFQDTAHKVAVRIPRQNVG